MKAKEVMELLNISSLISTCLRGKIPTACKYHWEYIDN